MRRETYTRTDTFTLHVIKETKLERAGFDFTPRNLRDYIRKSWRCLSAVMLMAAKGKRQMFTIFFLNMCCQLLSPKLLAWTSGALIKGRWTTGLKGCSFQCSLLTRNRRRKKYMFVMQKKIRLPTEYLTFL